MSKLQAFDSLSKTTQELNPLHKGLFNLYSCGPTVYNKVHIGNLRAYLLPDLVRRAIEMNGQNVRWVMNLTDVDDKTIRDTIKEYGSEATPKELWQFTEKFTQAFYQDLDRINIPRDVITFIRVTDKIPEIQKFIVELIDKGFAYQTEDGSTYFSIEKYQSEVGGYGGLVGEGFLEGKKIGARVKVDEYEKENLADFALWKSHDPEDAQIFWDHPQLGKGRPGWHIECTVINYDQFPEGTDIHTGGIDLLFPHHTNEIAQALPLYQPFVKHWMHNEHITVSDEKMSKRLGNFVRLEELESDGKANGLELRYLYLQSHYRTRSNVSDQNLEASQNGLRKLKESVGLLENAAKVETGQDQTEAFKLVEPILAEFRDAINNDLNTPEALAVLHSTINNKQLSSNQKLMAVYAMDQVLGLKLSETKIVPVQFEDESLVGPEIRELLSARLEAKNQKDYTEADRLRDEIQALGYEIIDTTEGQKLRRISE
jgi:cysteinyl-tRNA synthetase